MKTFAEQLKEHGAHMKEVLDKVRDLITAIKNTQNPKIACDFRLQADELIMSLERYEQTFEVEHKWELKRLEEYLENKKKLSK